MVHTVLAHRSVHVIEHCLLLPSGTGGRTWSCTIEMQSEYHQYLDTIHTTTSQRRYWLTRRLSEMLYEGFEQLSY